MKSVVRLWFILVLIGCSQLNDHHQYDDYHHSEDLKSFKAPMLKDIKGESYRLTWHAWHQQPGLILANCYKKHCSLELIYTNGYGTYQQGELINKQKIRITEKEFADVRSAFAFNDFRAASADLRHHFSLEETASDNGELVTVHICLHAPHYYLEAKVNKEHYLIYRYCQDNYKKDLQRAFPLIELAEKYFPAEMPKIKAHWLNEQ
jgi:hypothetical protein